MGCSVIVVLFILLKTAVQGIPGFLNNMPILINFDKSTKKWENCYIEGHVKLIGRFLFIYLLLELFSYYDAWRTFMCKLKNFKIVNTKLLNK